MLFTALLLSAYEQHMSIFVQEKDLTYHNNLLIINNIVLLARHLAHIS